MLNHTAPLLDVPAADAEFHRYASAIAAGRLADAIEPRRRLAERGIELLWQPGRSKAAPKAPAESPRTKARAPADPADEAWAEFRRAQQRRDYRAAGRCRRELYRLGYSVVPRAPQVTKHQATKRERRALSKGSPSSKSLAWSPGEFPPAERPGSTHLKQQE